MQPHHFVSKQALRIVQGERSEVDVSAQDERNLSHAVSLGHDQFDLELAGARSFRNTPILSRQP